MDGFGRSLRPAVTEASGQICRSVSTGPGSGALGPLLHTYQATARMARCSFRPCAKRDRSVTSPVSDGYGQGSSIR